MSQNNSDKDKSDNPFPSGPSAPKPDWLKDVEGETNDDTTDSTDTPVEEESKPKPPEGLRETQPIEPRTDDDQQQTETDSDETETSSTQPPPDSARETPDESQQESDASTPESKDNNKDREESSTESPKEGKGLESKPLEKDSRSQPVSRQTESKPSTSSPRGVTQRPSLPHNLIQIGALLIALPSLFELFGFSFNSNIFAVTSTTAGITGIVYGFVAFSIERFKTSRLLVDALYTLGLVGSMAVISGPFGLNLFSLGIVFSAIGIVLSLLDRV